MDALKQNHVLVCFAGLESRQTYSDLTRSMTSGEVYLIIDAVKSNGSFHGNIKL